MGLPLRSKSISLNGVSMLYLERERSAWRGLSCLGEGDGVSSFECNPLILDKNLVFCFIIWRSSFGCLITLSSDMGMRMCECVSFSPLTLIFIFLGVLIVLIESIEVSLSDCFEIYCFEMDAFYAACSLNSKLCSAKLLRLCWNLICFCFKSCILFYAAWKPFELVTTLS